MTDPVNLSAKRAQRDGAGLLDCPTCQPQDGTNWIVCCRFNGAAPFVASLICSDCVTEMIVENGTIVEVKRDGR